MRTNVVRRTSWMSALLGVGLVSTVAFGAACNRGRRASASGANAWYDPQPLLASLRPAARIDLARAIGVAHLEDLPLYDLDVSVDHTAGTFALREEVYFTNNENVPFTEVVFRVYANVEEPTATPSGRPPRVAFVGGTCASPGCTVAAENPSVIVVRPAQPLAPHARLRVNLELRGTLERIDSSRTTVLAQGFESVTNLFGHGEGDYGILAMGDGIVSLANFYPVLARRRAGAWERNDASTVGDLGSDEMSHVRASVTVDPTMRVVTTGVQTAEANLPAAAAAPARRQVRVVAGAVRDFAIVAGTDLQTATRNVAGVEVRSHFLTAERPAGERALDTAAHALEIFERRFGPYPYADLDVCEAALIGGAGGVEFAGLVTIASMFYRPPIPTTGPYAGIFSLLSSLGGGSSASPSTASMTAMMDGMLEFVVAHEVGHQWWHGLVGSDSRLHPYLDEGLAQFSAMLYLEDRYDAARAQRDGDTNVRMNYQIMRLLGSADAAVDRPVAAFGSTITYAGLVYGRGPYMYPELRRAVGDGPFFDGMREYVARNRFRVAPPRALIDTLATGANAPRVRAIATRWLDEAHGDEDLGRADLGQMLASMMGGAGGLPPELQQAAQVLQNILGGGGGAASGNPLQALLQQILGSSGGGGGGASALQGLLQQLMGGGAGGGAGGANPLQGLLQQLMGGGAGAPGGGAPGSDPLQGLMQQLLQGMAGGGAGLPGGAGGGTPPNGILQQLLQQLGGGAAGAPGAPGGTPNPSQLLQQLMQQLGGAPAGGALPGAPGAPGGNAMPDLNQLMQQLQQLQQLGQPGRAP